MKIKVRLYATLRKYMPDVPSGQSVDVTVPDGATVGDLLDTLGVPRDDMRTCYVASIYRTPDYTLREGDEVALFPPVGGGA